MMNFRGPMVESIMNRKAYQALRVIPIVIAAAMLLVSCAGGSTSAPDKSTSGASASAATRPAATSPRVGTGDLVEVSASWAQIRSEPSESGRAIGLAYGNDEYEVLEQQGDWVKIRIGGNRSGWVRKADIQ